MPAKSPEMPQSSKSAVRWCRGEFWADPEKAASKTKGEPGGDKEDSEDLEDRDVTDLGGSVDLEWSAAEGESL